MKICFAPFHLASHESQYFHFLCGVTFFSPGREKLDDTIFPTAQSLFPSWILLQ